MNEYVMLETRHKTIATRRAVLGTITNNNKKNTCAGAWWCRVRWIWRRGWCDDSYVSGCAVGPVL